MTPIEIAKTLDSSTIRFEKIILLAGATDGMSMTRDLEEFIDDHSMDEVCNIIPGIPDWCKREGYDFILEAIAEAEQYGFLVQCAVPVKKYSKNVPDCSSFSWGSYYIKWFYSETIEGVVDLAIIWSGEMAKKDKVRITA